MIELKLNVQYSDICSFAKKLQESSTVYTAVSNRNDIGINSISRISSQRHLPSTMASNIGSSSGNCATAAAIAAKAAATGAMSRQQQTDVAPERPSARRTSAAERAGAEQQQLGQQCRNRKIKRNCIRPHNV